MEVKKLVTKKGEKLMNLKSITMVAAIAVVGVCGLTGCRSKTESSYLKQTTLVKLKKETWRVLTDCSTHPDVGILAVKPEEFDNSWNRTFVTDMDKARTVLNAEGILKNMKIEFCIDTNLKPGRAYYGIHDSKIHISGGNIPRLQLYHEIGHYVMFNAGGFEAASSPPKGCGAISAWGQSTTPLCAFVEGWADFFATELSGSSKVFDINYADAPEKKGEEWKGAVATYLYELRKTEPLSFIMQTGAFATSLNTMNPLYCSAGRDAERCRTIKRIKVLVGAKTGACICDDEL